MDKKLLYTKAYRMLQYSTPLKVDCGKLCSEACCKGDEDTGMYLFPGEEVMYRQMPGFLTLKASDFKLASGENILLAVCSGKCDRALRPLACRVFPLTPYIDAQNTLSIKMDPRAKTMCPIARYSEQEKLNRLFVRDVRNVFSLLAQDEDIRGFLRQLSRLLDEYSALPWFDLP